MMGKTSGYIELLDKPSKVKKYELSLNGKVNENEVIVDKKSNNLQVAIQKNYDNIAILFNAIASNYRACAKKSVKGDKITSSLKKVAARCEERCRATQNRKSQLVKLYTADATKENIEALENFLGSDLIQNGYVRYGQDDYLVRPID